MLVSPQFRPQASERRKGWDFRWRRNKAEPTQKTRNSRTNTALIAKWLPEEAIQNIPSFLNGYVRVRSLSQSLTVAGRGVYLHSELLVDWHDGLPLLQLAIRCLSTKLMWDPRLWQCMWYSNPLHEWCNAVKIRKPALLKAVLTKDPVTDTLTACRATNPMPNPSVSKVILMHSMSTFKFWMEQQR